jgi:hypothetical protein
MVTTMVTSEGCVDWSVESDRLSTRERVCAQCKSSTSATGISCTALQSDSKASVAGTTGSDTRHET